MDSHRLPQELQNPAVDDIYAKLEHYRSKLPSELQHTVTIVRPDKRKQPEADEQASVLVTASPSPKKRKFDKFSNSVPAVTPVSFAPKPFTSNGRSSAAKAPPKAEVVIPTTRQSALQSSSTSIYTKAEAATDTSHVSSTNSGAVRDETLAVVENLVLCPVQHDGPLDDPLFNKIEPYSKINLASRQLSHEDLQEFLRARYFVPPSQLYSVVRPDKYRTGYDVMVEGDWVTIAVVAERGQIMSSKSQAKPDEDDSLMEEGDGPKRPNNRPKKPPGAREGKKYTKLTLVDFGHQSKSGSAAGDAMLELLLFEADTVLPPTLDANGKKLGSPIYRGGSGGAFEEMLPSLSEKAVVAILNPRVLRPYQGKTNAGSSKPHPTSNVLGITPVTPDAIKIIGTSKDLGMCSARLKSGQRCSSWCDKRRSEVCQYHLENAIKTKRAGRPEFSAGTSGMVIGGPHVKTPLGRPGKPSYDANKKFGLLPAASNPNISRSDGAGSTYIMSGRVIASATDVAHVSERQKKDQATKARNARERSEKKDEELLKKLLANDQGSVGAKAVGDAKAFLRKQVKGKGKAVDQDDSDEESEDAKLEFERRRAVKSNAWGPDQIKKIGFDPTSRPGERVKLKKLDPAALPDQKTKKDIRLSPTPGERIKSGVVVPEHMKIKRLARPTPIGSTAAPANDSDSDLEIEPPPPPVPSKKRLPAESSRPVSDGLDAEDDPLDFPSDEDDD